MRVNFYWEVITYNGEVFTVTNDEAAQIKAAKIRKVSDIEIGGDLIATNDIRLIKQSDRVITAVVEQKMIADGRVSLQKRKPLINIDTDGVFCQWVKTYVSSKKWESFYSVSGAYHLIGSDGNSSIIAYRRPIITNSDLPENVFLCNFSETSKLESMIA